MAEKGGRFNRFLNVIGLVEVNEPTQGNGGDYGDGYASDGYGTQQSYAPSRGRTDQTTTRGASYTRQAPLTSSRPGFSPTRSAIGTRQNERTNPGSRTAANGRGAQSGRGNATNTRRAPVTGNSGSYDYTTPRPQPDAGRAQRSAPRSRTVMLSLQELTDCCDVIDNLIMNNTVVLTMDDMDRAVMQRAIDTLSGAVFALHATFRRASEHTFLIAPSGVEVNDQYDPDSRF